MSNAKHTRLIAFDIDGVMTDGRITYTSDGTEVKSFNCHDGLALSAARRAGLKLAVITGRRSAMVERRAEELQFDYLVMGSKNKSESLKQICEDAGITMDEVAYMGDDLNDIGVINRVGFPMTPANGCPEIKERALFVSSRSGGNGAVREAVEYILKEQNLWEKVVAAFLNEDYQQGQ